LLFQADRRKLWGTKSADAGIIKADYLDIFRNPQPNLLRSRHGNAGDHIVSSKNSIHLGSRSQPPFNLFLQLFLVVTAANNVFLSYQKSVGFHFIYESAKPQIIRRTYMALSADPVCV